MFDGVVVVLIAYDFNLQDCRGQSYDNASPMSGQYCVLWPYMYHVQHTP